MSVCGSKNVLGRAATFGIARVEFGYAADYIGRVAKKKEIQ